jgi:rhodanese-related sulfurtransferase
MAASSSTTSAEATNVRLTSPSEVRAALLERREIALLDVREEAIHAEGHPLFAANLSLSRLEIEAYTRLPRRDVPIVLFDDGEGYAAMAAERLAQLGYSDVSLLEGGLQGWRDAGFEIFRDVNSPSKAFGELVEAKRHTPSLPAIEVKRLIESNADIVVVDVRRYDEFQTMSIPTAVSAPGAELVYRLQDIAERPSTHVIVNCAGRTRSIIGTQSLINAGLPNQVFALRNGTIGWKLAQQTLDHRASRSMPAPDEKAKARSAAAAGLVADAARVARISLTEAQEWARSGKRTVYLFDVRTPGEFLAGHAPGFRSAPGGQLVQETDMFVPVRGAQIVLADDDGTRANMTASWLAQMNWEVYVIEPLNPADMRVRGLDVSPSPPLPDVPTSGVISPDALASWLKDTRSKTTVFDFTPSRQYLKGHIPSANFALRSRLVEALETAADTDRFVVTASSDLAARLACLDLTSIMGKSVYLLQGGNAAWQFAGYAMEGQPAIFSSQPMDYYRRPYEGTDASPATMQAYLDWEFGLVEQLERDSTHGFWVLPEAGKS